MASLSTGHLGRLAGLACLAMAVVAADAAPQTRIGVRGTTWTINGKPTAPGTPAEGLLMNVRMVQAVFEDTGRPDLDPDAITARFLERLPDYSAHGVMAITISLQGGMPGYEGAVNSAFDGAGHLRPSYMARVERLIRACDAQGVAVILSLFYQRQSRVLRDDSAVRTGVAEAASWVRDRGFANVLIEIANEYPHRGFVHPILQSPQGQAELIRLAKATAPGLLVSSSGAGDGHVDDEVAAAADVILVHWNDVDPTAALPAATAALRRHGKPIVVNEDSRSGPEAVAAMETARAAGVSYGLMILTVNQTAPFRFAGAADDPVFYEHLRRLTRPPAAPARSPYAPPPESEGGWRRREDPAAQRQAGLDPEALEALRDWLMASDRRDFAAVVVHRGWVVLEVERGRDARTDTRRLASVSKAIAATVLAIAAERSRRGLLPRAFSFDDTVFEVIPPAQPLSDPRKAAITVRQLLNHTSGICPEVVKAPNDGTWEYLLGHTGDPRTARLAFDPGTACGYSTHAFAHAALVCEAVTGMPYDQFAIEALFQPLGIERWWFQVFDSATGLGRHPSHGLGLTARDLARIGHCMLHHGRWSSRQVIPAWFVDETAAATHAVTSPELRWGHPAQRYSHGWELPAVGAPDTDDAGRRIPADARAKVGSGGQYLAFIPSLDLVMARHTGGSGDWDYDGFLRRACAAVSTPATP